MSGLDSDQEVASALQVSRGRLDRRKGVRRRDRRRKAEAPGSERRNPAQRQQMPRGHGAEQAQDFPENLISACKLIALPRSIV